MAGPAGAHGGGHPDHGIGGPSGISGHEAGTGAESAAGGAALGPDAPAFGGTDPGGGGGGGSSDTSIEAFREAIARAMGVTAVTEQEAVSQEQTEAELDAIANARARGAAVEARNRTQREAREQQERQAMMDDIDAMQNKTNFATPAPAVTAVDLDTYDSKFATPHNMVDETETEKEYGPTFSGMTSPFGIDESQFDDPSNTDPVAPPAHPSRDPRIGMPMGVGRPASTDQQENREPVDMYGRVAPIEDIEDPEHRAKAYEVLAKLQKEAFEARTPLGKALRGIVGMATNNTTIGMIGRAIKAGLAKAGFNVDPNIIGQAIRAAHEQTTQGPLGAGGTSVGSRNDSFIENFLANLPSEEPWMKGLNERQIQYYLDRPSELEWVRNLYNQMNPMSPMFISPTQSDNQG